MHLQVGEVRVERRRQQARRPGDSVTIIANNSSVRRFAWAAVSTLLLAPACVGDDPPPAGALSTSTGNGSGSEDEAGETGTESEGDADDTSTSTGDIPTDDLPCEDPPALTFTKVEGLFGEQIMGGTFDEGNCLPGFLNPNEPDCQGESAGLGLSAGDYDGDGQVDLAVGAPAASMDGPGEGAVHVFWGPLIGP